jgi:hypothetical protein
MIDFGGRWSLGGVIGAAACVNLGVWNLGESPDYEQGTRSSACILKSSALSSPGSGLQQVYSAGANCDVLMGQAL